MGSRFSGGVVKDKLGSELSRVRGEQSKGSGVSRVRGEQGQG